MKYYNICIAITTMFFANIQASLNPADPYQGTIFDIKYNVSTEPMRPTPKTAPWDQEEGLRK